MLTTRKAQELDVVELIEDLPEFGLKKGERGAVVVAFDNPDEGYDLEFVDDSGKSKFAYAVKPDQIKSSDEILKEDYEKGMKFLNEGNFLAAEHAFKSAVELHPDSLGNLHNSIVGFHRSASKGVGSLDDLASLVAGLRFVLRINPNFKLAEYNIAIVYMNYGVQQAIDGNSKSALEYYHRAIGFELPQEVISRLKTNLAAAYTALSVEAQESGDLKKALAYSRRACEVDPNETTRSNLGAAYANLAWVHLSQGDIQTAGMLLELSQSTGLLAPEMYNNYGVALALVGDIDGAIKAFEKALEIAPEDSNAKGNLHKLERAKTQMETIGQFRHGAILAGLIPASPLHPQPHQLAA